MPTLTPQQVLDLAMQHHRAGRLAEAGTLYRQLLAIEPHNAALLHLLGLVAHQSGSLGEAASLLRQAISLDSSVAEYHNNLGNVLQDQGAFEEAVAAYRRAIALGPECAPPYTNLGNALKSQGHLEEALDANRTALRLDPDLAEAHANLADALHHQGNLDEAVALYRRAVELPGASAGIHHNYLATLHYWPQVTPSQLLEAHAAFDRRYAQPFHASWQPHANARDPERPLRLGFVSPHFGAHPVGRFLVRPLENLDQREFEVVCYHDGSRADETTDRLRAVAVEWHDTRGLTDEQLAGHIRENRIDLLFDLAGHTTGNRLLVFARKPAPIQITWLDYVGTTGLSAIDYILADPREIPPAAEPWYREKVLRMPDDYICFDPPSAAPPVGPLPAMAKGFVTFTSFNILPKTTPAIIEVWSRILREVPGARLLLKNSGFDAPANMARFRQQFAAHSIDPGRITLQGWSPQAELLAGYQQTDIALDTFPYNGGLTTCEALWMGVPVVTCPGETFASRHGLAHLTAAGIPETIARDLDDYVKIAVALASDLPKLSARRAGLRERVAASPLCDGARFAKHLTALLRESWRAWVVS